MENKNFDIVVLDTGVLSSHKNIDKTSLSMFEINKNIDDSFFITEGGVDEIGHGTAIISILQKHITEPVTICSIKILSSNDGETSCELEKLLFALSYIMDNISCKLIHLSCGVKYYNQDLKNICDKLIKSDKIIVAAFNNDGSVSFPAAFSNVIGVDASLRCITADDFVYVENSIVNIKAKGGNQRVAWVDPPYIINQGSSFAAPYVSAYIINAMKKGADICTIKNELKSNARYVYTFDTLPSKKAFLPPKLAAVFPYNKEMHSIVNFNDLLSFNIAGIYDIKQSGRIGKQILDFKGDTYGTILNYENIDYENIDCMVIGHTAELELYTKKKIKKEILENCLRYNVNVYSFDDYLVSDYSKLFIDKGLSIHFPYDTVIKCDANFGKLYKIQSPVISIMGTSMQQGKFSLQLMLKRMLTKLGYKVAHLATEPSGELFGAEGVYPFGYAGTAHETGSECRCILNYMMHQIDVEAPDIIINGSQSGTVPMIFENAANIYTSSIDFLLGTQPDAVILCVNVFDDISYIERSINAIQGLADAKVIALAVYPLKYPNNWYFYRNKRVECESNEMEYFVSKVKRELGVDVFVMNEFGYEELCNSIIDFFSE